MKSQCIVPAKEAVVTVILSLEPGGGLEKGSQAFLYLYSGDVSGFDRQFSFSY